MTKKKSEYEGFALEMDGGGFNFSMEETYSETEFIDMKIHFPIKKEHLSEFMDFIVNIKTKDNYILELRRDDGKKEKAEG